MAQKPVECTAVIVIANIGQETVQKVSRVYVSSRRHEAAQYQEEMKKAILAGTRPDLEGVWLQDNVRLYL